MALADAPVDMRITLLEFLIDEAAGTEAIRSNVEEMHDQVRVRGGHGGV